MTLARRIDVRRLGIVGPNSRRALVRGSGAAPSLGGAPSTPVTVASSPGTADSLPDSMYHSTQVRSRSLGTA